MGYGVLGFKALDGFGEPHGLNIFCPFFGRDLGLAPGCALGMVYGMGYDDGTETTGVRRRPLFILHGAHAFWIFYPRPDLGDSNNWRAVFLTGEATCLFRRLHLGYNIRRAHSLFFLSRPSEGGSFHPTQLHPQPTTTTHSFRPRGQQQPFLIGTHSFRNTTHFSMAACCRPLDFGCVRYQVRHIAVENSRWKKTFFSFLFFLFIYHFCNNEGCEDETHTTQGEVWGYSWVKEEERGLKENTKERKKQNGGLPCHAAVTYQRILPSSLRRRNP